MSGKNRRTEILLSTAALLTSSIVFPVYADLECKIVPKCRDLGYTKTASECESQGVRNYLKCPFDENLVYCPEDCTDYPFTSALDCDNSKGTCVRCNMDNRWKYTGCNDGYVWNESNTDCITGDCSREGYPYASEPSSEAGTYVSCVSPSGKLWKYTACNSGYTLSAGRCNVSNCLEEKYPYTTPPSENLGTYQVCQSKSGSEATYRYGYVSCAVEHYLSNGECLCDEELYPNTVYDSAIDDLPKSCENSDGTMRYSYTTCLNGSQLVDGECIKSTCAMTYVASSTFSGCPANAICPATDICISNGAEFRNIICKPGYQPLRSLDENSNFSVSCKKITPEVGAIYYYRNYPIGVYFERDNADANRWKIVAFHENASGLTWSNPNNISVLADSGHQYTTLTDDILENIENKGYVNTGILMEKQKDGTISFAAANFAQEYEPCACLNDTSMQLGTPGGVCNDGSECRKLCSIDDEYDPSHLCAAGNWYLPAIGELQALYDNWKNVTAVQTSLKSVGAKTQGSYYFGNLRGNYYWSSTENSSASAWNLGFNRGNRWSNYKYYSHCVRPVLAF